MIELVVLAALGFCAFVVIGTFVAAAHIVGWIISLPFRILGFLFSGLGLLIGLPFLLLAGFIGFVVFGVGLLVLFVPLLPLALLALAVAWMVKRNAHRAATS